MQKIYVGNLSYQTTEENLREDFAAYGVLTEVKLITDRETGRSKGFAFLSFETMEQANKAVADTDGSDYMGRAIKVSIAEDRKPRDNRSDTRSYQNKNYSNDRRY